MVMVLMASRSAVVIIREGQETAGHSQVGYHPASQE
jgi:hypothetical protein